MTTIRPIDIDNEQGIVKELFAEYLYWANSELKSNFGFEFNIEEIVARDMENLEIYSPPAGALLLAYQDNEAAGIGCLKHLKDDIGELKRMYVRKNHRGKGLGKALLNALLAEAKQIGYASVWLDSAKYMKAAHSLYKSNGFIEISPYPESEIPGEYQENWLFMKKDL